MPCGSVNRINPLREKRILIDTEIHGCHKKDPLDDYDPLDNMFYSIGYLFTKGKVY